MSTIVLRPVHFVSEPDLENFDIRCLTPDGHFLFHRHNRVLYCDNFDETDFNKMVELKR